MSLAAPFLITAKAIPEDLLLAFSVLPGLAAGLAPVTGRMQFAGAVKTSAMAHFVRHIRIDFHHQLG
jgi:hypothetical protein